MNNTPRASRLPLLLEGTFSFLLIFVMMSSAIAAVTPDVQTYGQLLNAIREVQAASEKRVEQAVDQEKVREAWETGQLIDAHVLQHKERADYGEKVIARLADDLGSSRTELKYMLEFFRTYPIGPAPGQLSWSHYRELLSINDTKAREEVTDEAVEQSWSQKHLRNEVHKRLARDRGEENISSEPVKEEKLAVSTPGNLYTYPIVKPSEGPYAGQLALDLGFAVTFRPPGFDLNSFKEGDVVCLENGKLTKAKNETIGAYKAYITEVIDGDTVHARIDLGLGITIHQKLRLRGIDAPIVESSDGREAKEFLEKHGVRSGAQVLIQTVKSDKYDRYLADIWTLRSDQASSAGARTTGDERWVDGNYINQQLIDQGLAVSVNE